MRKRINRLICLIMAMTIMIGSFATKAQAAGLERGEILSQEISNICEGVIQEKVEIVDSDGIEATIIDQVNKEGEGIVLLIKNDTILSEMHYEAGIDKYFCYEAIVNNEITTYGDITGAQYRHRYVGSTSYTYEENDLKVFATGTVAQIAATLVKNHSLITSVAISFASFLYEFGSAWTSYSKLEITSNLYEVVRSYDNTYYTHCYHCVYNAYDSGNHLIKSGIEYYQAIGG